MEIYYIIILQTIYYRQFKAFKMTFKTPLLLIIFFQVEYVSFVKNNQRSKWKASLNQEKQV